MSASVHTRTRDIARAAVRAELAAVALRLFCERGFDQVTINDLAEETGVSRSTFLRYFSTKEDAALCALDSHGEAVVRTLRIRPPGEDDWTSLRRSLDPYLDRYREDPAGMLMTARLVRQTPALAARLLAKQCGWRPLLAAELAERNATGDPGAIRPTVLAAAAIDCLSVAINRWADNNGQPDLTTLVDEAFDALASARTPRATS